MTSKLLKRARLATAGAAIGMLATGGCGLAQARGLEDAAVEIALDPVSINAGSRDVTTLLCPKFSEEDARAAVLAPNPPFNAAPFFAFEGPYGDGRIYTFHYPLSELHSVDVPMIFGADCSASAVTSYV